MPAIAPLPSSRLHATYDPALVPADTSSDIHPSSSSGRTPFQDRAMKALDLALNIKAGGYNVFLAGSVNLGRCHMLCQYLTPVAKKAPTPPDIVYLHNFEDPDRPMPVEIPAGQGQKLKVAVGECISAVLKEVERRLVGTSFMRRKAKIADSYQDERAELLRRMTSVAEHKGFSLDVDDAGALALQPLFKGRKVSEDDFAGLGADMRIAIKQKADSVAQRMSGMMQELNKAEEGFMDKERDLERSILSAVLDSLLSPLAKRTEKNCSSPKLASWFKALREDMLKHSEDLLGRPELIKDIPGAAPQEQQRLLQSQQEKISILSNYRVNVFVDNSKVKGAPIIVEDHPTASNLLGCVERESELGALVTDFTLIRSGSIHKANGGYLILHMDDARHNPAAWEGLLRALKAGFVRMDEAPEGPDSVMRSKGLSPEPVKLDLKVILIGDEYIYESLLDSDERFARLFRIKAEMTDTMPRNAKGVRYYLGAIRKIIDDEKLPVFDRTALAWLIDLGSHICEDQRHLSLKFPILREHMLEAAASARMQGAKMVTGAILEESYAARSYRDNLVEELYMEEYDRNLIKVETSGQAIGQVNGLSVTTYGSFEFGLPHRISCTVGVGHDGIIDLEREADLGGPIHTKAMMILGSYLTGMFASKKPLALSGSLFFEQSYAGIEGDSASGAELAALLSALAEVPVRLDLAFTGAVSHSGQIMAVGGVSHKIEGFFKVCSRQRLTGTQGVIIPADNVDQLMLSPTVLKAVDAGQFSIYPVKTIEDALFLLTGMNAGRRRKNGTFTKGSLYELVDNRLERLGEYGQNAFQRPKKRSGKKNKIFQKAPEQTPAPNQQPDSE